MGPDAQIVLEAAEHRFDLHQQYVQFPLILRLLVAEVGAQEIMAVVEFGRCELLLVHPERKGLRADLLVLGGQLDFHHTRRAARRCFGCLPSA